MDWGLLVLCGNVLLLASGWLLYQQAKASLSSQAVEAPVLQELKALHQSVALLVERLRLESAQCSAQMEARCLEARDLLLALERKLEEAGARAEGRGSAHATENPAITSATTDSADDLRAAVQRLAQSGMPAVEIAREIGLSQGEVEVLLSLERRTGGQGGPPPVYTNG